MFDPKAEPEFTATAATYDARAEELQVRLKGGIGVRIPLNLIPEIADATPEERGHIDIQLDALGWPDLDVHLNLAGLILDSLGPGLLRRELARRAGATTSEAKRKASAANGKKGGRPRKEDTSAFG